MLRRLFLIMFVLLVLIVDLNAMGIASQAYPNGNFPISTLVADCMQSNTNPTFANTNTAYSIRVAPFNAQAKAIADSRTMPCTPANGAIFTVTPTTFNVTPTLTAQNDSITCIQYGAWGVTLSLPITSAGNSITTVPSADYSAETVHIGIGTKVYLASTFGTSPVFKKIWAFCVNPTTVNTATIIITQGATEQTKFGTMRVLGGTTPLPSDISMSGTTTIYADTGVTVYIQAR